MKTNLSIYSTKGLDTIGRNVVHVTLQNAQEAAKTNVLFLKAETELNAYSPLVLKAFTTGMGKEENAAMIASIDTIGGGLIALTRFSGEIGFYVEELQKIIHKYLEK